jgi:hypothetical protein
MKKLFRYGAIASIFVLTAGPAAFAQNYNPNYGPGGGQGWNQSGWNQGSGGGWQQGAGQGWNQSGWNQGSGSGLHQGAGSGWTPGSGGDWSQGSGGGQGWGQGSGSSQGSNNAPSQQDAYQELSKYGFNNIRNLQRSEGWEAHATKNGDRVHVFLDDDGMIATYRGE